MAVLHVCHGLESGPRATEQDPPRFQAVLIGRNITPLSQFALLDAVVAGYNRRPCPASNSGTRPYVGRPSEAIRTGQKARPT